MGAWEYGQEPYMVEMLRCTQNFTFCAKLLQNVLKTLDALIVTILHKCKILSSIFSR